MCTKLYIHKQEINNKGICKSKLLKLKDMTTWSYNHMEKTVTQCCKFFEASQFNYFRITKKSLNPSLEQFSFTTIQLWRKIILFKLWTEKKSFKSEKKKINQTFSYLYTWSKTHFLGYMLIITNLTEMHDHGNDGTNKS